MLHATSLLISFIKAGAVPSTTKVVERQTMISLYRRPFEASYSLLVITDPVIYTPTLVCHHDTNPARYPFNPDLYHPYLPTCSSRALYL